MQISSEIFIAIVSACFGLIATIIALLAWIFPRQPKNKISIFQGQISNNSVQIFSEFIQDNDSKIVRINLSISMDEEEILNIGTDHNGNEYHTLTLRNPEVDGLANGGIELSINPEKGHMNSPLVFANGCYHLTGFFVIVFHPGMWQGFIAASVTEVSAGEMALRA